MAINKLNSKVWSSIALSASVAGFWLGVQSNNPSGFIKFVGWFCGGAGVTFAATRILDDKQHLKNQIQRFEREEETYGKNLNAAIEQRKAAEAALIDAQQRLSQLESAVTELDTTKTALLKAGADLLTKDEQIATIKQGWDKTLSAELKKRLAPIREQYRLNKLEYGATVAKNNEAIFTKRYEKELEILREELQAEIAALQTELAQKNQQLSEFAVSIKTWDEEIMPGTREAFSETTTQLQLQSQFLYQKLEVLQQENKELIEALNSPKHFAGATSIDTAGNRIIDHFLAHEIVLDAIETVKTQKGFKVRFKYDRTAESVKVTLNDIDKIKAEKGLSGLSDPLNFELDTMNYILSVELVRDTAAKATSATNRQTFTQTEVEAPLPEFYTENNLLPSSKFSKVYQLLLNTPDVPSVRVMGGSGSGKSSVVRLLLSAELANQKTRIRLHDPQSGSSEDRWGFPKISENLESTATAMGALLNLVDSKTPPPVNTIDVFDELDSAMRNKTHGAELKEAYLSVMTRVRHLQNQKLLVIGQNAKVGRTGLQWSDIDNCGNLYIGESAVHAIKSSPSLEGNKDTLKKQVDAIRAYCQERNVEAGLKGNEPNAYRFALVKAPNRDPFWVELPSFSEGIEPMENLIKGDVIVPATSTTCPQCGADDWKIHRRNSNGSIQYRCKSCGKTQTRK